MNMIQLSLADAGRLQIQDGSGGLYHGCDQDWFLSVWQRMAGCGPTVATNVLLYLLRSGLIRLPHAPQGKQDCLKLMESVWKYVTPTMRGVNRTSILLDGVVRFAAQHGNALEGMALNVPESPAKRPGVDLVVEFISEGLRTDCPVAFLNLSNGDVEVLDNWHWVTIVALEADEGNQNVTAHIYDNGNSFPIDLKLWCHTTKQGGGFVWFRGAQQAQAV